MSRSTLPAEQSDPSGVWLATRVLRRSIWERAGLRVTGRPQGRGQVKKSTHGMRTEEEEEEEEAHSCLWLSVKTLF